MRFVCDPGFDDVPEVGSGEVMLVARRREAGAAVRWLPGGDVKALVEFLGAPYVLVGDRGYYEHPDGRLDPLQGLDVPAVVVKPPAGEVFLVDRHGFTPQFAKVEALPKPTVPGEYFHTGERKFVLAVSDATWGENEPPADGGEGVSAPEVEVGAAALPEPTENESATPADEGAAPFPAPEGDDMGLSSPENFTCSCGKSFDTAHGMKIHKTRASHA